MPYWIRDIEERLMKIETHRETELEVCLNIMDVPPEDQNSQHGQEVITTQKVLFYSLL